MTTSVGFEYISFSTKVHAAESTLIGVVDLDKA